jgi:hypothetical protein
MGVGTVTGVMTLQNPCASQGFKDPQGCSQDPAKRVAARDEKTKGETTAVISTVGFIAGGAALTGALLVFLFSPSHRAPADVRTGGVTPELGAGWAGLHGSF